MAFHTGRMRASPISVYGMQPRIELALLLILSLLVLTGCVNSWSSVPPTPWSSGFWFWQGSDGDAEWSGQILDVLFVQVGTINHETAPYLVHNGYPEGRWSAYSRLPSKLPPAREYWLVYRFDQQGVPDQRVAAIIGDEVSGLLVQAQRRHLHLAGIQLDIDSPTGALPRYGAFLREVRKELPSGFAISITALLDWFRNGTSVGDVIAQVDEFVPQFYDIADPGSDVEAAIATRIDAVRWGPVFNRFHKRFRIGISTFGRARKVPKEGIAETRYSRVAFFGDVAPIEIATQPAFQLHTSHNAAHELVLSYRAARKVRIGYEDFHAGDTVQFILSTPDAVRTAVASARQMHGYLAGVVFFRWPSGNEALAMQPEEVLTAAGIAGERGLQRRIQTVNGHCTAVECLDVYLQGADPFSPQPLHYRVRSSAELKYFLPEKNMPVRMTRPDRIDVSLPPYCGRGRLYLGRAVAAGHTEFTVEEQ